MPMLRAFFVAVLAITAVHSTSGAEPTAKPADGKTIDFAHQIAPILREHCVSCHAGASREGGLSLNTREELLEGGENGKVIKLGQGSKSWFIGRLTSENPEVRMPPDEPPLAPEKIALLTRWIDAGMPWDEGFAFVRQAYEPPLLPRTVTLPPAIDGRTNPVDRVLDHYLAEKKTARPEAIEDGVFTRRAYLDLVGLLPPPGELAAFIDDRAADKREKLIAKLLADDTAYAEHWLTFWNDLLRNDYSGTGFITGGRKQISRWLYESLIGNKPYDEMARELIAPPTPESAGFADGIRWRGDVSAGATVEIQFAQSVGQSFLGINLKCASCHDSFIDRWKLDESYGLAAIYSTRPLEIHRCDKPIGRQAKAAWLFPEIGQIDAAASQPDRLKQLAALLTSEKNGRFTRTIVNRLWHRLMGRGIVHPTDAMQTEPWNADLLDYLAADFAANGYDLKHTLSLIATSAAYQSRVEGVSEKADEGGYAYVGPRAKRLTAEQFVDAVWQLTGSGPQRFDAPIIRGAVDRGLLATEKLRAKPISAQSTEADANATEKGSKSGQVTFRQVVKLTAPPLQAMGVLRTDAPATLWANGKQVGTYAAGDPIAPIVLTPFLRQGANSLLIVVSGGRKGAESPRVWFEARAAMPTGPAERIATGEAWQWTTERPNNRGQFVAAKDPKVETEVDWQKAAVETETADDAEETEQRLTALLQGSAGIDRMVRAALVKSDFLMRSLGRPNRDQIVSVRPADVTTLEAIDLSNGQALADALTRGAPKITAEYGSDPAGLVRFVFRSTLCRDPRPEELTSAVESIGAKPTAQAVEDLLWAVLMLPEFMLVR
jgi:hypothetical protein